MRRIIAIGLIVVAACSSAPPEPVSVTRGAEANARWREGRIAAAEAEYDRALEEDHFRVDVPATIKHLNNLGVLALYDDRIDEARGRFAQALDLCAIEEAPDLEARLRVQLACCHLRAGDLASATEELSAIEPWSETAEAADRVQVRLLEAGVLLRRGEHADAAAAAQTALGLAASPEDRAAAQLLRAKALTDDRPLAREAYQSALREARVAGQLPILIECLVGVARTYASDNPETARRYCRLALEAARARGFQPGIDRAEQEMTRLRN